MTTSPFTIYVDVYNWCCWGVPNFAIEVLCKNLKWIYHLQHYIYHLKQKRQTSLMPSRVLRAQRSSFWRETFGSTIKNHTRESFHHQKATALEPSPYLKSISLHLVWSVKQPAASVCVLWNELRSGVEATKSNFGVRFVAKWVQPPPSVTISQYAKTDDPGTPGGAIQYNPDFVAEPGKKRNQIKVYVQQAHVSKNAKFRSQAAMFSGRLTSGAPIGRVAL